MSRILVIDDNPISRELVESLLAEHGHAVDKAADSREGLKALYESRPDLIVLDINMPERDGWETLERIRELSDVPVLVLTGDSGAEPAVRALRGGADDFVTKSFDTDEFTQRVERLLRNPRRPRPAFPVLERVGPYVIGERLGSGGMGVVFSATHASLGRRAAVKVMPHEMADDPNLRRRFEREWRTAASLHHPNIVPIYDAGEADGVLYLAMQLIDGPDLLTLVRRTPGGLDPQFVARVVEQVAAALGAAHAAGVIHRDVKPGNVLVDGEHCFLTDFGLSKLDDARSSLTQPGRAIGTAHYLAPEQIKGAKVDERTDVYGLGCLAFEALTGAPPFAFVAQADDTHATDVTVLFAQLNNEAPRIRSRRPELPEAADGVVARAVAKRAEERYPTPMDLAVALRASLGA
jgi:serine/threonine protein kinase